MNFKEHQSAQKLRGGYYTPDDLAAFLVRWISKSQPSAILEPSCGDGVFFPHLASHLANPTITSFEIDPLEAKKASDRAVAFEMVNTKVNNRDFLGWAIAALNTNSVCFDAVVGNPPFIRYQYLPREFQSNAERIFRQQDCKFTKHTNAWVPFVLASFAMLRPGGKLAMVVPSEIIHVGHAQSLRTYLGAHCSRLVIVDPEELWFSGTLQGAVILLAEKKHDPRDFSQGLGIYPVQGRSFTENDPEVLFQAPPAMNGKTVEGKWTRALLTPSVRELLGLLVDENRVAQFDALAKVDVGIVTGANNFFLVTDDVIDRFSLHKWAQPMFGRSGHCPGVIYDEKQHRENAATGKPTNFLRFPDTSVEDEPLANSYIRKGERDRLHTRYKCRIRTPWYTVPSVYSTEVGMLKRSHDAPRLIHNQYGALTTDTAYRITLQNIEAQTLVYSFVNALTALSAEVEGRHYGGGVLELVPSEIEKLLIPISPSIHPQLHNLDAAIRETSIADVLYKQNLAILGAIGLTTGYQDDLMQEWRKLRDRRCRTPSSSDTQSISTTNC